MEINVIYIYYMSIKPRLGISAGRHRQGLQLVDHALQAARADVQSRPSPVQIGPRHQPG